MRSNYFYCGSNIPDGIEFIAVTMLYKGISGVYVSIRLGKDCTNNQNDKKGG